MSGNPTYQELTNSPKKISPPVVIAFLRFGLNRTSGANLKGITSFFLRAKHWQIFILVFGVYFVGQMALVGSILTSPHSQEVFSKGGLLAGLVMTFSTLGLFVWLWSLGSYFNSIVQPELRMESGFF